MNTRSLVSVVSLLSIASFAHAEMTQAEKSCQNTANPEACLQQLKHEQTAKQDKVLTMPAVNTAASNDILSRIHIGVDPAIPTDQLVVSMDQNEKDIELLRERSLVNNAYGKNRGFQAYLSGKAELTATRDSVVANNGNKNDIYPDATVDIVAQANDWLLGLAELKVSDAQGDEANKDKLILDQGLVTVGNLDVSPIYATVGDYYMPFGRYNSYMVSDSLPKLLGGTKAKAISLGWANKDSLNSNFFFMQKNVASNGAVRPDQNTPWGASIDFERSINNVKVKTSLSYVNSMANGKLISSGLCNVSGGACYNTADSKDSHGVDAIATLGYGPFEVSADYLTAIDDMTLNTTKVKPTANHLEARYLFKTLGKNSDVAVSYGQTKHIADLPLPSKQYGATYSVAINDYITTDVEYVTKKHVNVADAGSASPKYANDHVVTGDVVVWF